MKINNKLSYITVTAIALLVLAGCVKDNTLTIYNGPDLIEFGNPVSRTIATTTTPKKDSVLVQLVGKQRSTATNVNYTINSSSTAVAGTDYTILTPSPVTIAPNTSSAWIYFTLNKVSSSKKIIINLTGGDNVTVSENYKTFTYTLN